MSRIKTIRKYNSYFKSFSFAAEQEGEGERLEAVIGMDEQGNTVLEEKYDAEGELEERNTYIYNKDGKLTEHILLYAVDDVTERRALSRDDKGRLTEETKYYGDEPGEKTTYVYDAQDNLTERTFYDEEGVLSTREQFLYDDKGSIKEQLKYDASGELAGKTIFTEKEERTFEQCEYDSAGKLLNTTITKFNEEGKELSSAQTTPEGKLISGITSVYDDKGNVVERHYRDFYSKTVRHEYDEQNRLIMQEMLDGSGTLLRKNLYEYDDAGNIIAEQTYEMDTTRGGRDKHFSTRYEYEFHA